LSFGNGLFEGPADLYHAMTQAIQVHAFDVDLDIDLGWLFTKGLTVIDGGEPATDADLFADLGDSVTVRGDIIGQGFGFLGVNTGTGATGGGEALSEVRVFVDDTGEPALRDTKALGDGGLSFASFNTLEDTGIPSALRFDLLLNEGLQGARGHEGRVCTNRRVDASASVSTTVVI